MESESNIRRKYLDTLRFIPVMVVASIIFYFSGLENPLPPGSGTGTYEFDITVLLHIGEFALLSFCAFVAFHKRCSSIWIIAIGILYALSDEIHQYFIPNRYFDVFDILFDTLGIFFGMIGFFMAKRIIEHFQVAKSN